MTLCQPPLLLLSLQVAPRVSAEGRGTKAAFGERCRNNDDDDDAERCFARAFARRQRFRLPERGGKKPQQSSSGWFSGRRANCRPERASTTNARANTTRGSPLCMFFPSQERRPLIFCRRLPLQIISAPVRPSTKYRRPLQKPATGAAHRNHNNHHQQQRRRSRRSRNKTTIGALRREDCAAAAGSTTVAGSGN